MVEHGCPKTWVMTGPTVMSATSIGTPSTEMDGAKKKISESEPVPAR